MEDTLLALVPAITQLALGAAAYKLASALKLRVDNHEQRLIVVEVKTGIRSAGVATEL